MRFDLFLISFLTLFLELTCIRWFPSHVLFLTFFTNTVLLASILGISVGCLAANRKSNLLIWTPLILMIGLGSAHFVDGVADFHGVIVPPFSGGGNPVD